MNSKEALERLRVLIGEEKYAVVARELSGVTVYFPENYVWQDKKDRNARLKEDF